MRAIVPAYVWPGDDARWAELLAFTHGAASVFVINPDSGPGLVRVDDWALRIRQIHAAGHLAHGYTACGRGTRAVEFVEEVGRYARIYPELDGVFIDGFPAEAAQIDDDQLDYLAAGILFARRMFSPTRNSMDAFRVVANPGVMPSQLVVDAVPRIGVWVVCEDRDRNGASVEDIMPPRNPGWLEVKRQAWLSYNDPAIDATHARLAAVGWHWGYSTSDPAPRGNPWDLDPAT